MFLQEQLDQEKDASRTWLSDPSLTGCSHQRVHAAAAPSQCVEAPHKERGYTMLSGQAWVSEVFRCQWCRCDDCLPTVNASSFRMADGSWCCSRYLTGRKYACWGRSQINYILGRNGRSYVVGLGSQWPAYVAHPAASCSATMQPCASSVSHDLQHRWML